MKIEQKYKTNKNFGIYNSLLYIFKLRAFPKKFRKLTVSDHSLSKDMIKHIAASDIVIKTFTWHSLDKKLVFQSLLLITFFVSNTSRGKERLCQVMFQNHLPILTKNPVFVMITTKIFIKLESKD